MTSSKMGRPVRLSPEQDAEALAMSIQGKSRREIGEHLGVAHDTASRAISRALKRITAERGHQDIEEIRSAALLSYDDLEHELRDRLRQTPLSSPASGSLASAIVRLHEARNRLHGLEVIKVDHRVAAWTRLESIWNQPVAIEEVEPQKALVVTG